MRNSLTRQTEMVDRSVIDFVGVRIEKAVGKIKPPKRAKVEQENSIVR
jgi:hypothetical protein